MEDFLSNLSKSLALSAPQLIIVIVFGFLLKKYFENQLMKVSEIEKSKLQEELEKYKSQLESENNIRQLEIDKSFEEHRNKLEIFKLENHFTFSKLHDERSLIIAQLHEKLTSLDRLVYKMALPLKDFPEGVSEHDYMRKHIDDTIVAFDDFSKYFRIKRIYFSSEICDSVHVLIKDINDILVDYDEKNDLVYNGVTGHELEYANEAVREAWFKVRREIPKSLSSLEDKFRQMLGVSTFESLDNN
jgi:uncharacterized membrane-anchored protein YhcB (DUF1043 family)